MQLIKHNSDDDGDGVKKFKMLRTILPHYQYRGSGVISLETPLTIGPESVYASHLSILTTVLTAAYFLHRLSFIFSEENPGGDLWVFITPPDVHPPKNDLLPTEIQACRDQMLTKAVFGLVEWSKFERG